MGIRQSDDKNFENGQSIYCVTLTHICNRMLSTETFSDRLKYSEIKPIYKKGTKPKLQITGQFHYSLYFLRSLKRFYIRDHTITYLQTRY
jgi:hypothetical protein